MLQELQARPEVLVQKLNNEQERRELNRTLSEAGVAIFDLSGRRVGSPEATVQLTIRENEDGTYSLRSRLGN